MKNLGKKFLMTAMATTLVATSVVGLSACGPKNNAQVPNNLEPTAKDVFSMAAVSGASFIGGGASGASCADVTMPISNSEFDTIKTYLGMFNDLLSDGIKQESLESDKAEYNTKIAIKIGSKDAYTLYYTETAVNADGTEGREIEGDEEDETIDECTTLEGILVANDGTEYAISGGRTVTTEEDEKETEVKFKTSKDGSTVEVVQTHEINPETNEEETEFEYKIEDADGNEISYSIEWEFEDGANEMEVEISSETSDGVEIEKEYSDKSQEDGSLKITLETENADVETEDYIIVTENEDGTYNFKFSNGYEENNVKLEKEEASAPETEPVA